MGQTNDKCDSCLMPLSKDTGKQESADYCSYCYKDGGFLYKGNSLREFQELSRQGMIDSGMNPLLARLFAFTIRFAPRWRNK